MIEKLEEISHRFEEVGQLLVQPDIITDMNRLNPQKDSLEEELKQLLIPKDPNDSKDVILEIRAGTGGDEAAIFAGDLFRMYQRFAEKMGHSTVYNPAI